MFRACIVLCPFKFYTLVSSLSLSHFGLLETQPSSSKEAGANFEQNWTHTTFSNSERGWCFLLENRACHVLLRFLLTLPFALPQLYHQYLALVWLLIYWGATYAYQTLRLGLIILHFDSMIIA